MQREAIGRNDVEADAGHQHDPARLRLGVLRLQRLIDREFAGDVEIMGARAQAGARQRLGGVFERPGAVQNDGDALQRAVDRLGVRQVERAALKAERSRDPVEPGGVAPGDDRLDARGGRRPRDMLADEAGRAIDEKF